METAECAIRYAGEFYDSETGLYYLRARYYNPYIGRFISEDSYWGEDANPLSLNRYTYTHNDPIQYLDPTGHAVLKKGVQSVLTTAAIKGTALKKGTATKQVTKDNVLKAAIAVKQVLTESKTVSAEKNVSDSEKAIAKGAVTKAKTDDIKENRMLMFRKTSENIMYNRSNVQTKEGLVQTVVRGKPDTTPNFLVWDKKEIKVDNLLLEKTPMGNMKRFGKKELNGIALNNKIVKLSNAYEGGGGGSFANKGTGKTELTEEQKLLIATVYGEAANCSEASWEAVANVIKNRVGSREWKKYDTVTKVIKNSGFDAYTNPNNPYKTAEKYLNNRDGSNAELEKLISTVQDVYNGKSEDNTNGAVHTIALRLKLRYIKNFQNHILR